MDKYNSKILILDDAQTNLELLVATLEPLGCEIISHSNPIEALEDVKNQIIDLAIIDIVMPQMDGFNFTEKFIETHKNTSIIYVSAHKDSDKKIKGYNLGSYAYIEKPFNVQTTRAQIKNILKLKHTQDELRREKEKLDFIYEFSQDEIIITDKNFKIISQNNKLLNKNEYQSLDFIQILEINNQTEGLKKFLSFTNSNKQHLSFRAILENTKYVKTNISKIESEKETIGYLIMMVNITEEVKAEKERDRFIATISHDLKTPVRAETNVLELLLKGNFGELKPTQKEIIQEILNSSKFMMRMTDNVLTRYKLKNGKYRINKTTNSIKQTLEFCISNLKYLIESANQTIQVTTDLQNDKFNYDEIGIRRVITNLITNASEHSPQFSNIYIIIKQNKDNFEISVKDEGIGISKEKQKHIFEEYYTSSEALKKVGSGLGLFISKKIIESHGGQIYVNSSPNSGSVFTFSLPIDVTAIEEETV